jgi:hypothetical protein
MPASILSGFLSSSETKRHTMSSTRVALTHRCAHSPIFLAAGERLQT